MTQRTRPASAFTARPYCMATATTGTMPRLPRARAPGFPPPPPTALLLPLQVVRQVLHAHLFQERPAWTQHRARVGRCPYHRAPLGGNRPWEGPCRAGSGRGGRARMASQPDLPLQFVLGTDSFHLGYAETGHCLGKPNPVLPPPQRLEWDIPEQVCGPRRGRGGCVRVTMPCRPPLCPSPTLRGKVRVSLMVQTDSRENRDPRTVWGLEKDVRCELMSGKHLSVTPSPTEPSWASALMPPACLWHLLLRTSGTLRPAQPCLPPLLTLGPSGHDPGVLLESSAPS